MTKARAGATELEGTILGALCRAGGLTAYAVRRLFLSSLSEEWSGSAGAVYPAIARLEARGLLKAGAEEDGRGGRTLVLTSKGKRALEDWLGDVARAAGAGTDPFRSRAGVWIEMPAPERKRLLAEVRKELLRRRAELAKTQAGLDAGDTIMLQLHLAQLDLRLAWIETHL